ncbi:MAG: SAM-dependent methyltransferase [Bacteroidia bacterium]|jgi:16S rRNA (cytidine1402-2'-O)-methyltransferase|nr:SAM-dependent methyltransferase [Bacteroidia bacterium]
MTGTLYLLPVPLGDEVLPEAVLSPQALSVMRQLKEFVVENEKAARQVLKRAAIETPQAELVLHHMGKHIAETDMRHYLHTAKNGGEMGLLSDAGCPGVADPGAVIVRMAHEAGIKVVPLTGPSSLLLALMASGMNGQQFMFHGYLPIDQSERRNELRRLEADIQRRGTTHLFIETPFRNQKFLQELLQTLHHSTRLCVACDITLPTEWIRSCTVAEWKKLPAVDLQKRPAVFVIGK